jgi:ABC-type multidrug transport system fused ATPase/permease subunit
MRPLEDDNEYPASYNIDVEDGQSESEWTIQTERQWSIPPTEFSTTSDLGLQNDDAPRTSMQQKRKTKNKKADSGGDDTSGSSSLSSSLGMLLRVARPELGMLLLALFLMIGAEATGLLTPLIFAKAYDVLVNPNITENEVRLAQINSYMALALYIHVAGIVGGFLRSTILGIAGERVVARLRNQLYANLLSQEMAFFDDHKSGELVSRLGSDTVMLQTVVSHHLPEAVLGILKCTASLVLMFWISIRLTGLTVDGVIVMFLVSIPFGRLMAQLSREYQNILGQAQTHSTEALGAMRTVQSFVAEEREAQRYKDKIGDPDQFPFWIPTFRRRKNNSNNNNSNDKTTYSVGVYKSVTTAGLYNLFGLGYGIMFLMLWYGFHLVTKGEISLGQLTAFQSYILTIGYGLGTTSMNITGAIQGLGASGRICALMNRIPQIPTASPPEDKEDNDLRSDDHNRISRRPLASASPRGFSFPPPATHGGATSPIRLLQGHVQFQNVSFAYPTRPNVPVLKDFTFSISANTTVAFVGPSGVGKSTLLALLQRFYDIRSGTIRIDGVDIRNVDLHWLRRQIGYVEQEPPLFGRTVKENVLYGTDHRTNTTTTTTPVTQEEIEQACKIANAHDFVMEWPDGYETLVGERGAKLSGGQKQRLAIARAILTNCRILLLDEATSALDTESEQLVQDAIEKAVVGRTVLIVAHRLSTIRRASQIVVMDKKHGIVDVGTHEALVERCYQYNRLIKRQHG